MTDTKPQKLSLDQQENLDGYLADAAWNGYTDMVQSLLATGADVHTGNDRALYWAVQNDHAETVKLLLAAGANVHARNDEALCWSAWYGYMETTQILAKHIFTPDFWRGKSCTEIKARANVLYDKIKANNPSNPIKPEHLRMAGTILSDYALRCWEQVRPAPPKVQISPLPAQPRPL